MNLFLYKCNFIPHVNWIAWRGTCFVSALSVKKRWDTPTRAETAEEALTRSLRARENSTDRHFLWWEGGPPGRVSFPFSVI